MLVVEIKHRERGSDRGDELGELWLGGSLFVPQEAHQVKIGIRVAVAPSVGPRSDHPENVSTGLQNREGPIEHVVLTQTM